MPPPEVYGGGMLDPLPEQDPMELIPYRGLLYATDRRPAAADDNEKYYANDRGQLVRLGVARTSLHEANVDWPEVRSNRARPVSESHPGSVESSCPARSPPPGCAESARYRRQS